MNSREWFLLGLVVLISGGLLCLWLFLPKPPIHAIGARRGGMAYNLVRLLKHLDWCERGNMSPIVHWDKDSLYFDEAHGDNAWSYYFQPTSCYSYKPSMPLDKRNEAPDGSYVVIPWEFESLSVDTAFHEKMHGLMGRYIHLQSELQKEVDDFYRKKMRGKKVVGLHIRGTDKSKEIILPDIQKLFDAANKHAPCTFFIATDEEAILNQARKQLKGEVISQECIRAQDDQPLHYRTDLDKYQLGKEVILDMYLLSKCQVMIHNGSNIALIALCINPEIKAELITKY